MSGPAHEPRSPRRDHHERPTFSQLQADEPAAPPQGVRARSSSSSSTAGTSSAQRTASQIAIGRRKIEMLSTVSTPRPRSPSAPDEARRTLSNAQTVGARGRRDSRPCVDLDHRARARPPGRGRAEQRQQPSRSASHEARHGRLRLSPSRSMPTSAASREEERLEPGDHERRSGRTTSPIPRNSQDRLMVHTTRRRQGLPPRTAAARARSGVDGRHVVREITQLDDQPERGRARTTGSGSVPRRGSAKFDPAADRPAEEVGRARPERAAGRHRVALVAPVLGPRDRLRPLRLQVRPGRAVVERLLLLAPAALEARSTGRPAVAASGSLGIEAAAGRRSRATARRVVAADALLGASGRGRAPSRRSSRASRPPDRRPGASPSTSSSLSSPQLGRARRPRAGCTRPRRGSRASASSALPASKTSWIISQSPSCVLFQSLKG